MSLDAVAHITGTQAKAGAVGLGWSWGAENHITGMTAY